MGSDQSHRWITGFQRHDAGMAHGSVSWSLRLLKGIVPYAIYRDVRQCSAAAAQLPLPACQVLWQSDPPLQRERSRLGRRQKRTFATKREVSLLDRVPLGHILGWLGSKSQPGHLLVLQVPSSPKSTCVSSLASFGRTSVHPYADFEALDAVLKGKAQWLVRLMVAALLEHVRGKPTPQGIVQANAIE